MGKFALLVGVSEYKHLGQLPNAARDLEAMRNVLEPPELGAFEVKCLENPDKSTLEIEIYNLFANRQKEDVVLFYFSGHAMRDRQFNLYFGLSATQQDAKQLLIPPTATDVRYLHQQMDNSRSERQVIILDCCFSGAFAKGLIVKGNQAKLDIKLDELGGKGQAILTSAASTTYSFSSEDLGLSIYTHYLVEGIRTGAADLNSDGMISADELYRYIEEKIHQESPTMSPKLYSVQEGYRITVANAPQNDPTLKYRKKVIEIIQLEHENIDFIEGKFDPVERDILDVFREEFNIDKVVAAEIETQEMQPYRLKWEKINRFKSTYEKFLENNHGSLGSSQIQRLRRYQETLGLKDEDIALWLQPEDEEKVLKKERQVQTTKKLDEFKQRVRDKQRVRELNKSRDNDNSLQVTQEIFISYAWGGDSEKLVNKLEQNFRQKGISIVRDKHDLGYKGEIKDFMEKIGLGKAVITVISDKYLRSENCMFELVEIARNGDFYDRIFPIVLPDAQIYKPAKRVQYIQHWEKEISELDEALKNVGAANLHGFRESIDLYTNIRATIAELAETLKNMNTLTPDMHSDSGFIELIKAIEEHLEDLL